MSKKIPKLSAKLYHKLAQLLSEVEQRPIQPVELTREEESLHQRYYEAFMKGQNMAEPEQDQDDAA